MFKGMKKTVGRCSAALAGVVASASAALATEPTSIIDVSGLTPDTSMVGTLALAIAGGLMGIWGIRKVIKLVNRS